MRHVYPKLDARNGVSVYGAYLDRLMGSTKYDHIEATHFELGYTGTRELWLAYGVRRSHKKYLLTLHDPPVVTGKPFLRYLPGQKIVSKLIRKILDVTIGRLIIRRVVRGAAAIIVLNPLAKPLVAASFNLPAKRIYTLPLPPLLERIPALPTSQEEFRVLYFGNLSPRKGVDLLLEAFAMCFDNDPGVRLVVVGGSAGETAYMQKLEAMRGRLSDPTRVEFTGAVTDGELATQIAASDVVVLPYYDPKIIHASGPLITSMAFAKPVIASDIPIFSGEVTQGANGWLFKEGSASELAAKLQLVRSEPRLAKEVGETAANYIRENHNQDIIRKQLIEVYQSL